MTTINADMSDSQLWIPLSEADALAAAEGWYTVESENLELSSFHMTHASRQPSATNRPNGRTVIRGVGGSTPASHSSGATLSRYYPEAPGTGGVANPMTSDLNTAGQAITAADDVHTTAARVTVNPATSTDGGVLTIQGGEHDELGYGGSIQLGPGGEDAAGGGNVSITGGAAIDGFGGGVEIAGAAGALAHGGSVSIAGGSDGAAGAGAKIIAHAADGSGAHGLHVLFYGGAAGLPASDPAVTGALYAPGVAALLSGGTVPVVPLTIPSVQNVIDALIALGLVTQSD